MALCGFNRVNRAVVPRQQGTSLGAGGELVGPFAGEIANRVLGPELPDRGAEVLRDPAKLARTHEHRPRLAAAGPAFGAAKAPRVVHGSR